MLFFWRRCDTINSRGLLSELKKEWVAISIYQFIASEYELPALLSPKLHHPDGRDKKFESIEDLGDLEIVREIIGYLFVDITIYTKLPYIYRLNLEYTPERGQRLWEYLKANCQSGKRCEVWSIDLGAEDLGTIQEELLHLGRTYTTVETLSLETVEAACKVKVGDDNFPRVLVVK